MSALLCVFCIVFVLFCLGSSLLSSSYILDPIGEATGTVIWLHGVGETIQQIKYAFQMIKPKVKQKNKTKRTSKQQQHNNMAHVRCY